MEEVISREELKAKLDRGEEFKLVMVMAEWAFEASHIPGSININKLHEADQFSPQDEIVVYCTGGRMPRQPYRVHLSGQEKRVYQRAALCRWTGRLGRSRLSAGRRTGRRVG